MRPIFAQKRQVSCWYAHQTPHRNLFVSNTKFEIIIGLQGSEPHGRSMTPKW